jgi:Ca2+:H+ antiporter
VTRGLNRPEQLSLLAAALAAAATAAAALTGAANTLVFLLSALALVALAWIVGVATEQLGESAGPKISGVLNATFGNAAELIITIFAIRAGELEVAKASITGSILGNTLLVLGASFLLGGLRNGIQTFDRQVAGMNASMLMLAAIGLGLPTLFDRVGDHQNVQAVSDITAVVLLTLYVLMLIFFFRSPQAGMQAPGNHTSHWSAGVAIAALLASTALVAVMADVFVGTLDQVVADLGISVVFLGLIIVPLVGNIAENVVGLKIAYQNNMDFSMLVSLGSSLQVALGVAPALVFISLLTPHHFDLVFPAIQVVALVAAVLITSLIAIDGESNWLEGAQLMAVYAIVAAAVWYL